MTLREIDEQITKLEILKVNIRNKCLKNNKVGFEHLKKIKEKYAKSYIGRCFKHKICRYNYPKEVSWWVFYRIIEINEVYPEEAPDSITVITERFDINAFEDCVYRKRESRYLEDLTVEINRKEYNKKKKALLAFIKGNNNE